MKKILSRALGALVPLALLVLAPGCGSNDIIDPIYEIPSERSLVVVPFKAEGFEKGYDSPLGIELADRVTKNLQGKAEFKVKPQDELLALFDQQGDARQLGAREIAEKTGADYVLLGDVRSWQLRDPGSVNLLRGTSAVTLILFESPRAAAEKGDKGAGAKKGRIVRTTEVTALYPNEYGLDGVGVGDFGGDGVRVIETGLKTRTAKAIAELLYPHTKEEQRLAAD